MDLIYNKDCRFEEPMVADILGHKFKGKADVVNIKDGYIIDLKTSIDVSRFKNTFKSYGYHTQSYLYQTMFGMPLIFIVIGKIPKKRKDGTIYYDIGKVKTNPTCLGRGLGLGQRNIIQTQRIATIEIQKPIYLIHIKKGLAHSVTLLLQSKAKH